MIIDTKHPLSKYAVVRDAEGQIVQFAHWVDTEAGQLRRYVTNGFGKVLTEFDEEAQSWRLKTELLVGKFTVTFENVPWFKRGLLPEASKIARFFSSAAHRVQKTLATAWVTSVAWVHERFGE